MESRLGKHQSTNQTKKQRVLLLTGIAALFAVAVNFALSAISGYKDRIRKKGIPGSNVSVNLSSSEILKLAEGLIARSKKVHDEIASIPLDKATYTNAVLPLAELEAEQFPLIQSCIFPKFVSTLEDVRKASSEAASKIDSHDMRCSQREDVYGVIKAIAQSGEWPNPEAKHLIECMVKDFERNGLNLTQSKKEEVQHLKYQIDDLSMQYVQNIQNDNSFLAFNEFELEGLPSKFLNSLLRIDNGKIKVMLTSNHVSPILEYCKAGKTRKMVATAYGKKCSDINVSLFERLVHLRHMLARLLGYSSYAEFMVASRMPQTQSKIFDFLEDLSAGLTDLANKELCALKNLKIKSDGDASFGIEDLAHYARKFEDQFDVDFGSIKQYFPLMLVLSGIFKILQDLFGLKFSEILCFDSWHDDVQLFSILDLSSKELCGYLYLDMFSREGKYDQICVMSLQDGSLSCNGTPRVPVVLLIFQFQKPDDGFPLLLRFSEAVRLFHEFGHVVHHICNRATFSRFSGLRVDSDFVELPAYLFENWCYEDIYIKLMSGFHKDITKPIPDELCKALKRKRYSFSAIKLRQEILYGLFDQIVYSNENVDVVELFKSLHSKVMLGLPMLEGSMPASSLPRCVVGSESTCYSRIWSQVFAADMFAAKFKGNGLLSNRHCAMELRKNVLAKGGALDPSQVLVDFLGRQPSIRPFLDLVAESSM